MSQSRTISDLVFALYLACRAPFMFIVVIKPRHTFNIEQRIANCCLDLVPRNPVKGGGESALWVATHFDSRLMAVPSGRLEYTTYPNIPGHGGKLSPAQRSNFAGHDVTCIIHVRPTQLIESPRLVLHSRFNDRAEFNLQHLGTCQISVTDSCVFMCCKL